MIDGGDRDEDEEDEDEDDEDEEREREEEEEKQTRRKRQAEREDAVVSCPGAASGGGERECPEWPNREREGRHAFLIKADYCFGQFACLFSILHEKYGNAFSVFFCFD